jgi:hypothetical protein
VSRAGLSDADYWNLVDELIVRASTSPDLGELARVLPGVFPTDIVSRLEHLTPRLDSEAQARLRQHTMAPVRLEALKSRLPLPHPLDYEWRFTRASCHDLLDRLSGGSDVQSVALLGTPGLAEAFKEAKTSHAITLYERREEACDALRGDDLRVMCADLSTVDFDGTNPVDVVIADPPWYPSLMQVFIFAASSLLKRGGKLLLCSPGVGTRPSVGAERFQTMEFCHEHGLVNTEISPGILTYESPPFEVAALGAAGLSGFPADWRRGDLLTFLKAGDVAGFSPDLDRASASPWREVVIGRSRIRVKVGESVGTDPLEKIVEGDILDSVSRRDKRRDHPNVWTSTNHVYRTSNPEELLRSLRSHSLHTQSLRPEDPFDAAARRIAEAEIETLASMNFEP